MPLCALSADTAILSSVQSHFDRDKIDWVPSFDFFDVSVCFCSSTTLAHWLLQHLHTTRTVYAHKHARTISISMTDILIFTAVTTLFCSRSRGQASDKKNLTNYTMRTNKQIPNMAEKILINDKNYAFEYNEKSTRTCDLWVSIDQFADGKNVNSTNYNYTFASHFMCVSLFFL